MLIKSKDPNKVTVLIPLFKLTEKITELQVDFK